MEMPTKVSVDKITLLWRYPAEMMHSILAKAQKFIQDGAAIGYHVPSNRAGAQARLLMMLLDEDFELSGEFADLRFCVTTPVKVTPHNHVRVEWNPAKAGPIATAHILEDLKLFLPDGESDLLAQAFVTRIDLAVDVPGIRCSQLAAQRTSNHKNAQVFVGPKGEVNSIRIGARGSSAKIGTFLRVYDKPLPDFDGEMGVRAEIELSRSGFLAGVHQIDNPFAKFRLYQFPPDVDQGLFACFVSAAREKGVKRAMALLSNAKNHAAEFQAIVDQCSAPWWNPDPLWQQAKERTASIFGHHAGAAPVPIAKAA
jgi:hypothetical protein